jgi:hypothetical protein
MINFEQFLAESVQQGHTNLLFERGMYSLAEDLERVLHLFAEAGVPFQVIGGLAVNAHLMAASRRSRSFLTRDIDLLVRRADLEEIVRAAKTLGYEPKRMLGGYALIGPGQELPEAVQMLFVGESPSLLTRFRILNSIRNRSTCLASLFRLRLYEIF